jgi:hypothetical protein
VNSPKVGKEILKIEVKIRVCTGLPRSANHFYISCNKSAIIGSSDFLLNTASKFIFNNQASLKQRQGM